MQIKKLTLKQKILISFIIVVVLFLIPEKVEVSSEQLKNHRRIRYCFPMTILCNLLGIKQRTYILVDYNTGYKDRTIHIFNYWNNKAYQFVISEYGNSFMVLDLNDVH